MQRHQLHYLCNLLLVGFSSIFPGGIICSTPNITAQDWLCCYHVSVLAAFTPCRSPYHSAIASSLDYSRPPLCPSTTSANDSSCHSSSMAIPLRQSSNPFPQIARSCPKPIAMPRNLRQNSLPQDQDELQVFIPPHELAATSLMDPSCVSDTKAATMFTA